MGDGFGPTLGVGSPYLADDVAEGDLPLGWARSTISRPAGHERVVLFVLALAAMAEIWPLSSIQLHHTSL